MRLFVALTLPEPVREQLHRAAAPLRALDLPVRWVDPAQIHVTLKFLGDVSERDAGRVGACVERVAGRYAPFALRIEGLGGFPDLDRPRVVWAGVQAPAALTELQSSLEAELEALGFARERRPFHPHVTIGRVRSEARRPGFRALAVRAEAFPVHAEVSVRTVDLIRSTLGPRAARHDRITASPLGVAAMGDGGAEAS